MDSRFISSHQCISECLNNYQQLISLQILFFFFNQKLPMGTVTYKVAGLFDTLLVCCCCFVVEKSYVHIFFTSPKKNQKHSIRFWYFFKSIFFTWNYFYPTETYFCDLSETLRNFLHLRFWADLRNTSLTSNQTPVLFTSVKIHCFMLFKKTCDPEIEIK